MRKIAVSILLSFLAPFAALAATAGFVPSTGIWFSETTLSAKETVWLYTVIFNNKYKELSGTVVFYDNDNPIDNVAVKNLGKEQAEQVKVVWQPTEGRHVISARFTSAQAIDESGRTLTITVDGLNSQPGLPLTIGSGGAVAPTDAGTPGNPVGSTVVNVEKKGTSLAITAPPAVLGEKIAATGNSQSSTPPAAAASEEDLFAKNRAALEAAKSAVNTVTTTAATINKAYTATKEVVDQGRTIVSQGQELYEKVKVFLAKAQPYIDKVKPWWNKLTNNNEPKRLLIIFIILFIIYLSFRYNRRRERYWDR